MNNISISNAPIRFSKRITSSVFLIRKDDPFIAKANISLKPIGFSVNIDISDITLCSVLENIVDFTNQLNKEPLIGGYRENLSITTPAEAISAHYGLDGVDILNGFKLTEHSLIVTNIEVGECYLCYLTCNIGTFTGMGSPLNTSVLNKSIAISYGYNYTRNVDYGITRSKLLGVCGILKHNDVRTQLSALIENLSKHPDYVERYVDLNVANAVYEGKQEIRIVDESDIVAFEKDILFAMEAYGIKINRIENLDGGERVAKNIVELLQLWFSSPVQGRTQATVKLFNKIKNSNLYGEQSKSVEDEHKVQQDTPLSPSEEFSKCIQDLQNILKDSGITVATPNRQHFIVLPLTPYKD